MIYRRNGSVVPSQPLQQLRTRDVTDRVRLRKCIIRNVRTPQEKHDLIMIIIILTIIAYVDERQHDPRITYYACFVPAVDFSR
jgi:hypothetical protein